MIVEDQTPIEARKAQTIENISNITIYLSIPTNILCIDNRLEPKYLSLQHNKHIQDFTATLYLGKITFQTNTKGNLAPIYIPSNITESSFDGLNTFWLNEINKDAKTPFKSMIKVKYEKMLGKVYEIDSAAIDYQRIYYFRSKHNTTLTKEQTISYFMTLHSLNTAFIKNYIDTINNNNGITAYVLHNKLYLALLQQNILQDNMFQWYNNNKAFSANNDANLITLDYLKANNQSNFKILLYDKLFYAYLVWSLKHFIAEKNDNTMRHIDTNNLAFNLGAYSKYFEVFTKDTQRYDISSTNIYFNQNRLQLFMGNSNNDYIYGYTDTSTPNNTTKPALSIYDEEQEPIFKPSPLGNYYFELSDSTNTFIEYYQRIYPSINTLPKHWSKEMIAKLDLTLN